MPISQPEGRRVEISKSVRLLPQWNCDLDCRSPCQPDESDRDTEMVPSRETRDADMMQRLLWWCIMSVGSGLAFRHFPFLTKKVCLERASRGGHPQFKRGDSFAQHDAPARCSPFFRRRGDAGRWTFLDITNSIDHHHLANWSYTNITHALKIQGFKVDRAETSGLGTNRCQMSWLLLSRHCTWFTPLRPARQDVVEFSRRDVHYPISFSRLSLCLPGTIMTRHGR